MFRSSFVLLVVLCLLIGADYLSAWTAPLSVPPAGSVAAPVNTGAANQLKSGALGVGPLSVFGRMYVQGSAALPAPNTSVALEVEGSVAASAYCDGDGGNCTNAADLGGAGVGQTVAMGVFNGGQLRRGANVTSVVQSGTAWVVTLSSPPTGDNNYIVLANAASNAQASVYVANPTQFVVQARSSNMNNFLAPSFSFVVYVP